MQSISEEDYYFTEFESKTYESDYHSFYNLLFVKGVYLAFDLNNLSNDQFNKDEFLKEIKTILINHGMIENNKYSYKYENDYETRIDEKKEYFLVVLFNKKLDVKTLECAKDILSYTKSYLKNIDLNSQKTKKL